MSKLLMVRLKPGQRKEIAVVGNRNPRGYDNKIEIWLDEADRLHISVLKPDLCYKFSKVNDYPGMIEVIQE